MKIYWILPKNIALSGAIDDYGKLEKEDITSVVNCRAEQHDDICELSKRDIAYYWIPVVDEFSPRSSQIDTFLRIMRQKKKVLVHCAVGRGRSAMLVAVYLVSCGIPIKKALIMIKKRKRDVSLTEIQLKKLNSYFDKHI